MSIKTRLGEQLRSDFAFCPALADILDNGFAVGRSGKRLDLSSFSTITNLLTLRGLQMSLKPRRTMEVGFASGGSCLVFTQTHRDLGSPAEKQHVAIDPYQRSHWIDEAGLAAVEHADLTGYLDFVEDYSCDALPLLVRKNSPKFGIVYIDGSHLFEDVFVDLYYTVRLLDNDGVILFDDSSNRHVRKVLRFVRTNLTSSLSEIDLTPYRSVYHRSSVSYQIARSVGKVQLTGFRKKGDATRSWDSPFRNF